jgi:hypothetical protein
MHQPSWFPSDCLPYGDRLVNGDRLGMEKGTTRCIEVQGVLWAQSLPEASATGLLQPPLSKLLGN